MKYSIPENGVSRWVLDHRKPRRKYECPNCHAKKHFTRYIDAVTGQEAGSEFGICDNGVKCGYKKYPTSDLLPKGTPVLVSSKDIKAEFMFDEDPDSASCIPASDVIKYMNNYQNNKLYLYLAKLFGHGRAMDAIMRYRVGTIDHWTWKGCMLFWQIDKDYVVRTGKIMEYNDNGNRVKEKIDGEDRTKPHVTFYHCSQYADFTLRQCLFGEHLLNEYPDNVEVNIVESEKTALACYIKNPKKLYMATGGLQNIREKTISVLSDRRIVFYPDKGEAFKKWQKKVADQLVGYNVHVSDFLEKCDKVGEGKDLADLIFIEQLNKLQK